jgi:hypothetical protein
VLIGRGRGDARTCMSHCMMGAWHITWSHVGAAGHWHAAAAWCVLLPLIVAVCGPADGAAAGRGTSAAPPAWDLTGATVHLPPNASSRATLAAEELLLAEVWRLGGRGWRLAPARAAATVASSNGPSIHLVLGPAGRGVLLAPCAADPSPPRSEQGFIICASSAVGLPAPAVTVAIVADSELGIMLGAGRLLRELRVHPGGNVFMPAALSLRVDPAPAAHLRGHQVTDWGFYMSESAFEQFVKSLVVFGTNQLEFAHVRLDERDELGIPRNDLAALVSRTKIVDKYGLNVSLWRDQPWPVDVASRLFAAMPRLDCLYLEGSSAAQDLEATASLLRHYHPQASVFVDCGGFTNTSGMVEFRRWLSLDSTKKWVTGVSYGPTDRGLAESEYLAYVPHNYVIRLYPDLCHTLLAMIPVPDWHYSWALTERRHIVNPSPATHAAAIRMYTNASFAGRTIGFGAYSEGAGDDLHKAMWSALYMEPQLSAEEVVEQYSRFAAAPGTNASAFAGLLWALERNWQGDAAASPQPLSTLSIAEQLHDAASSNNWRVAAHLFRAYLDAFVQARLRFEQQQETLAQETLAAAIGSGNPHQGVAAAVAQLQAPLKDPTALGFLAQARGLAQAINASAGLCGGCIAGGMAVLLCQNPSLSLDTVVTADISDRRYLLAQLSRLPVGAQAAADALRTLLGRSDPGPGGVYLQPGRSPRSSHLAPSSAAADPQYVYIPQMQADACRHTQPNFKPIAAASCSTLGQRPAWPVVWSYYVQTYGEHPLTLHFSGLDTERYGWSVKVLYNSQTEPNHNVKTRLSATNGKTGQSFLLHDYAVPPMSPTPLQYALPSTGWANVGGPIVLECRQPHGVSFSTGGCFISEVWLLRGVEL